MNPDTMFIYGHMIEKMKCKECDNEYYLFNDKYDDGLCVLCIMKYANKLEPYHIEK